MGAFDVIIIGMRAAGGTLARPPVPSGKRVLLTAGLRWGEP
jgi:choline dehydrogenase-like flavoprotein